MSKDIEKLELRIQVLEQNLKTLVEVYDKNFHEVNQVIQVILSQFVEEEDEQRIITL